MIAERISRYVSEHGIKQAAIANSIGMSPAAMSETLAGRRRLTADEFVAICDFIGVPYSFFVNQKNSGS